MTLEEYCELLAIKNEHVDVSGLVASSVTAEVRQDGFAIVHDIIDKSAILEIRKNWAGRSNQGSWNRSDLLYGQANYSKNFYGRYTRHFEFYWNEPRDALVRDVSLLLHYARNIATGYCPMYGLA